jgi:ATP-binding cassette subfamily B (MDR/TAP) protein 1
MDSLHKNQTYDLVEISKGKKVLRNKWMFTIKKDSSGKIMKHKARLMVKGFLQKKGIDFDEIFSPLVKMTPVRAILELTACLDLEIEQMDVKTAFIHGDLHEEINMTQPEGFEVPGKENLVCKQKKNLYVLKQTPRQWYKKFDSFMGSQDYRRTIADQCVYFQKCSGGDFVALLLYVDDMLIVGKDVSKIKHLKEELFKSFDMKDLGPAQQILGMHIYRDSKV